MGGQALGGTGRVHSATDLVDSAGGGLDPEALGFFGRTPLITVAVDDDPALDRFVELARHLPCVVVGVAAGSVGGTAPPDLDLLLTTEAHPPRPWVSTTDLAGELDELTGAVARSPLAVVALVQLLRFSPALSTADALVAESFVYSMLQSSPHHVAWLEDHPRQARPVVEGVVSVERLGTVLSVTLDRAPVRNAYSAQMRDELVAALQLAAADPSIERVTLGGAGPAFCSGGDLDEFGTTPDAAEAHVVRVTRSAGWWLDRLSDRVTVTVHGACVGAGVELPAFAGHVEARSGARFSLPEVAMGLVPGAGGTASIPRRIGRQRTVYLAVTGRPIDVDTALEWGLVDDVIDAVVDGAAEPGTRARG